MSAIGLTGDRSCDSSQQLAFHSVFSYRFFCWKPAPVHLHNYPLSNLLFSSKSWIRIIVSGLSVPLVGLLQGSKDLLHLIEYQ